MVLEAGVDYIVVHPALDHIGFYLHRALGILICKACGARGLASNAKDHVVDRHDGRALLRGWDREGFDGLLAQYGCPTTYEDVVHPAPRGPPIQKVERKIGFVCTLSPSTCAFATTSQEWMVKHVASSVHDRDRYPNSIDCYKGSAVIQTVFAWSKMVKWVEVEPSLLSPHVPESNPLNHILQVVLPTVLSLGPHLTVGTDRERTRFMAFVDWDRHMAHYRFDRQKHQQIKSLLAPVGKASKDPLRKIKLALLSMMDKVGKYFGGGSPQAFPARKHILHGADISRVP